MVFNVKQATRIEVNFVVSSSSSAGREFDNALWFRVYLSACLPVRACVFVFLQLVVFVLVSCLVDAFVPRTEMRTPQKLQTKILFFIILFILSVSRSFGLLE